jgi:glutaconate CoA-transferase subunit A
VAEPLQLDEAVRELVHDGDSVALEGFTHLIPFAAGHEIARQGRRELTLIRMTPDLIYDQLIGMGCAPALPFAVLRGYVGTDLMERSETIAPIVCPFTGETLTAVPATRPDVGVVHAQRADREGNVQLWGIVGVQKEIVLASARSLVTVEEVVDELEPKPGAIVLPTGCVTAVAEARHGAHPSYAHDYYDRDNGFYQRGDAISRDRDSFRDWVKENVG